MQDPVFRHPALTVRGCHYGWGVFTLEDLAEGTVLERCPYLELADSNCEHKPLRDYVFGLTDDHRHHHFTRRALPLGWGALYNHADEPNVAHSVFAKKRLFQFVTTRAVTAGEQLYVSYGPRWWSERGIHPRAPAGG
jgi:hypothetical protein